MPKHTSKSTLPESVSPGEIYLLARPRLRMSSHPHYCVVLRVERTEAIVNFMSSEEDCFDDARDVLVRESDDDFKATGLSKRTYVINSEDALVKVSLKNLFEYGGAIGRAEGRFRARIEDEIWGDRL